MEDQEGLDLSEYRMDRFNEALTREREEILEAKLI